MKKALVFLLVLVALFAGAYLGNKAVKQRIPAGFELIATGTLDSIQDLKPDTITKDSIIFRDTTIYIDRPIPAPEKISDSLNLYVDSIINDSTYIVISDLIRGTLEHRDIELRRSVVLREIKQPYPVFYPKIEYVDQSEKWNLYAGAGVGSITGLEFGAIKNNWMYGGELLYRYHDERFFMLKVKRILF